MTKVPNMHDCQEITNSVVCEDDHRGNVKTVYLLVSRTARPDTFGSDTGGFRGSLYAGESRGPPAESRHGCRVRNRDQSALAGEEIPSYVSG